LCAGSFGSNVVYMEAAIASIIKRVLLAAGLSFTDITTTEVAGQKVFRIETENGKDFIGMRGETLRALDHIVKKIAESEGVEDTFYLIDVNDYRTKHIFDIQSKARIMAARARSFRYDVELTPMSSYERLIVHSTLADEDDITTESHGEGRNRRVVIRYASQTSAEGASAEKIA